jgi:superfamily I DNA/RNA helicase
MADEYLRFASVRGKNELRPKIALTWKAIVDSADSDDSVGIFLPSGAMASEISYELRNPDSASSVRLPVYTRIPRDEAAFDSVVLALLAVRDFSASPSELHARRAALALVAMDVTWNNRKTLNVQKVSAIAKQLQAWVQSRTATFAPFLTRLSNAENYMSLVSEMLQVFAQTKELSTTCNRIAREQHGLFRPDVTESCQLSLFDQFRAGRAPKGLEGESVGTGRTQTLSYHRTKGREFSHVIMVVEPYSESKYSPLDEQRRLYYVCATRAKKTLSIVYVRSRPGKVLGPALELSSR